MLQHFQLYSSRLYRSIWFLPSAYVLGSIVALAVAPYIGVILPDEFLRLLKPDALEDILKIIASSMLAVAIFSLVTMVSTLDSASTNATPRARVLLTEDRTAQNAISTFIGAFIFSISAIIGLSTGYYGVRGAAVILIFTLVIIALVITMLILWINRVSKIGGVDEVVRLVESATMTIFAKLAKEPLYKGKAYASLPEGLAPVCLRSFGYLQHITEDALGEISERLALELYVAVRPGDLVGPSDPVLWASAPPTEDEIDELRDCFVVGDARTFEEDPRFGLLVLSEIASRSLSPALNDPGTAIHVLNSIVRVLRSWRERADSAEPEVQFSRLYVQRLDTDKVVVDGFRWIARDGAAHLEVGLNLHRALAELRALDPALFGAAAERMSAEALERARTAMTSEHDIALLVERRRALGLEGSSASAS